MIATSTADWIEAIGTAAAAVGTVGALIAALYQIGRERKQRKRQEHRWQAERVSAWMQDVTGGRTLIALSNDSDEPVYKAVVTLVLVQGAGPRTGKEMTELGRQFTEQGRAFEWQATLSVIPPGRHNTTLGIGWGAPGARPGVELAFTDRSGVHWMRSADGSLTQLAEPPVDYYGIASPVGWEPPAPG